MTTFGQRSTAFERTGSSKPDASGDPDSCRSGGFENHSREGAENSEPCWKRAGAALAFAAGPVIDELQVLTSQLGDRAAWFQYWEEAVRLSRQLGEKGAIAHDLKRRATFAHRAGDLAGGIHLMREALRAAEQSGERRDIFWASNDLGSFLLDRGYRQRLASISSGHWHWVESREMPGLLQCRWRTWGVWHCCRAIWRRPSEYRNRRWSFGAIWVTRVLTGHHWKSLRK